VERRSEQRIAVSLPVVARGIDLRGSPFTVTTETRDISFSGASLSGLHEVVVPESRIQLESHGRKAWYRVQWVAKDRDSKTGGIGLRSLEPGRHIWGIAPKGWEVDAYDTSMSSGADSPLVPAAKTLKSWMGQDRRRFARHACEVEAWLTAGDASVALLGKITDVSLGGCRFQTESPLPANTPVQVSLKLDGSPFHLLGTVCSSETDPAMRIAFTSMGAADFEALRRFAPPAVPPGKLDDSAGSPSAATIDAVVRLLLRKGVLTSAELSEEIQNARSHRVGIPE
jgi:PilZ domain-containing protein